MCCGLRENHSVGRQLRGASRCAVQRGKKEKILGRGEENLQLNQLLRFVFQSRSLSRKGGREIPQSVGVPLFFLFNAAKVPPPVDFGFPPVSL